VPRFLPSGFAHAASYPIRSLQFHASTPCARRYPHAFMPKTSRPTPTPPAAYARDWLSQNNNAIVMLEHDKDHIGCVDIMTAKNDHLYLYAIEGEA
jgi:hypothetical protein